MTETDNKCHKVYMSTDSKVDQKEMNEFSFPENK